MSITVYLKAEGERCKVMFVGGAKLWRMWLRWYCFVMKEILYSWIRKME